MSKSKKEVITIEYLTERLKVKFSEIDREISKLKKKIHEQNKEIHEQNKEIHELNKEIHEQNKEIHELKDEINKLKDENKKQDNIITQLQNKGSSSSLFGESRTQRTRRTYDSGGSGGGLFENRGGSSGNSGSGGGGGGFKSSGGGGLFGQKESESLGFKKESATMAILLISERRNRQFIEAFMCNKMETINSINNNKELVNSRMTKESLRGVSLGSFSSDYTMNVSSGKFIPNWGCVRLSRSFCVKTGTHTIKLLTRATLLSIYDQKAHHSKIGIVNSEDSRMSPTESILIQSDGNLNICGKTTSLSKEAKYGINTCITMEIDTNKRKLRFLKNGIHIWKDVHLKWSWGSYDVIVYLMKGSGIRLLK